MSVSRRQFCIGAAAFLGCRNTSKPSRRGQFTGPGLSHLGHRVGSVKPSLVKPKRQVDVLIIGAGVSGLSAAWRLQAAQFSGSVAIMELAPFVGGTAAQSKGPHGFHPLGAHYITLPNLEAGYMRRLLSDLKVIDDFDSEGRPRFDPHSICFAPESRLFTAGGFVPGIWPSPMASPEDDAQRAAFESLCESWRWKKGRDGRFAFSIPIAKSSDDPEFRQLVDVSFSEWLDQQGFTSAPLRWLLAYGSRDDYGARLDGISAWAGLHYHCARRPYAAFERDEESRVLTWPGGNGELVSRLVSAIPWPIQSNALALSVEPDSGMVAIEINGEIVGISAQHIILAVPSSVADRLVGRSPKIARPQASPWLVGGVHCEKRPRSMGLAAAWDSVVYESKSLGYIDNSHQKGLFAGPSTLSWYYPFDHLDIQKARRQAASVDWWSVEDLILTDLSTPHPDIAACVTAIDVHVWGHGTIRPVVGLHRREHLSTLTDPVGVVQFCHTDNSGISLFEEATYHGIRAAEAVLARFNRLQDGSLL